MMIWIWVAVILTGCAGRSSREENAVESRRTIEEVLAAHTDSLMAVPGVVGTAIGLCDQKPCILVLLADSGAVKRGLIPQQLEGYRVRADVTGRITPR
jgi:hypothetical protein